MSSGHPPLATIDVPAIAARARARLARAGAGAVDAAMILGSGLSHLAGVLEDAVSVPYDEIPDFPRSTVEGHAGEFVVGTLEGARIACAAGRFHLYEGYPPAAVALTVKVLHALGPEWLLVTNAAGSLDPRNEPGPLMAITDHLNLQFANPLRGRPPETISNPFPDMSNPYDAALRERLVEIALEEGIDLREGVYAGVLGPTYETPAEIRFLRRIGADAVGMSTVGEAIAAAEVGLPVVGISLLTNFAAGLSAEPLAHAEVTEIAEATRGPMTRLVRGFVRRAG
ncbi:MAG: purine-nucleoside phosphorylase [Gemmatimonadota bacterium]|nr:purine-nucleoside phosphorylase [Gemmatimonadota bacterium]